MTNASHNRRLINPAALHPTPGFSHIAVGEGTKIAMISGQMSLDRDFTPVGLGDIKAQTVRAMENIKIALEEIDAQWDDVYRRTIYTTQPEEFETITAGIEKVQDSKQHPAQTIVGVTGLAIPGMMIEIEATVLLNN